jgi:hypothetical protein
MALDVWRAEALCPADEHAVVDAVLPGRGVRTGRGDEHKAYEHGYENCIGASGARLLASAHENAP